MRRSVCLFALGWFLTLSWMAAQETLLQSGPMVGYADYREVALWVQTTQEATVYFEYWEVGKPEQRYRTTTVRTKAADGFTARVIADQLEPGRKYEYALFINGQEVPRPYPLRFQTLPLWQWRTDPPNFRIAVGSCLYINEPAYDRPGRPYGGDYEILKAIHEKQPDAMLWLGDNVYLREVDWNTRSGMIKRYTHTRSTPEMQPLLGSVHHYAIWDDHDYGPNNSDRSFWNRKAALEVFKLFWCNPIYGADGTDDISGRFEWGDVEFFLLDNRMHRSPNNRLTGKREILGEQQLEWLIDALTYSKATFKIIVIGGQVLNPVARWENYATYAAEREKLLRRIEQEGITGVIFLTGDRHHTEITKLERPGTYPLYDITVSPLTSRAYNAEKEPNYLRVPGTMVGERNFAILEFSGPRNDRKLTCRVFDKDGKELWSYEIKASELK